MNNCIFHLQLIIVKTVTIYEKLAAALAIVLLALVCGTGFWVYNKLSVVVNPVMNGEPENNRLIMLKELNSDLVRAENNMFAYALSDNDSMATAFFQIRNEVGFRLKQLKDLPSQDSHYPVYMDTLAKVVDGRFETMEALMIMRNENRVNEAMNQVLTGVRSIARNKQQPVVVKQEEAPEKKRWFARKKKKETPAPPPQIIHTPPSISAEAVNSELTAIRKDVVSDEQQKNARKLVLEQRNNQLIARFTQLMQKMEVSEKRVLLDKARKAHIAAAETNEFMWYFSITSALLIGCVAYLIVALLRKTRQTTRELQFAKEKSDRLTEYKSRFLANMSHEIRTPLNAIVGFAEQVHTDRIPVEDARKVEIIRKSAAHLTQITNDILDFSKINSGVLQLENTAFSVKEECDFVTQQMQELVARNHNRLEVHIDDSLPAYIHGDPLRFRQVLLNLLSNAAKFTKHGEISLMAAAHMKSANPQLEITVRDTGIGISPDQIGRIFEEFEQAETTTTREFGGTGLGLTITRKLVQLMNGTIHVKSTPGTETVFSVKLPLAEAKAPETAIPEPETAQSFLMGKRILIVDDEEYNRKLLLSVLKDSGAILSEAEDGEAALKLIGQQPFDLVLLDLRMPKRNGFDTRAAMLEMPPPIPQIPVIALTAALSHEERIRMLESNWQGVLLKPLRKQDLLNVLAGIQDGRASENTESGNPATPFTFNLEPLREISGTDLTFYMDMLRTLLRTATDGLQAINLSGKLKDWEGMAEAAHKIAPPVKHIQAMEVYDLLKSIERSGRSGIEDPAIPGTIKQLNYSMGQMLEQLCEEIDKVS